MQERGKEGSTETKEEQGEEINELEGIDLSTINSLEIILLYFVTP